MRTALLPYRGAQKQGVSIYQGEKWSANAIFSYAVRNNLVYISEMGFVASRKAERPSSKSEYKYLRDVGGGSVFVEFDHCPCCGRGDVMQYTYDQLRFLEERQNSRQK